VSARWQFWIDRGGTFTDCIGLSPEGEFHTAKLLSSDTAPLEAIESVLARAGGESAAVERRSSAASLACRVKLGTTVATNALLERRGVPTALVTNRGLSGVFEIGTQERPDLFALEIERPATLPGWSIELPGRRDATGRSIEPLDLDRTRVALADIRAEGAEAVAIVWMHSHAHPGDEERIAEVARELGFRHVVASHEIAREIGLLSRGETAIADAYLTPLLRDHLLALQAELPAAELALMQSSGGLTDLERFRGPNALLSGPAGGVVAARHVAREAGHTRAIGFDMGGTSTDVSLIEGERLDRAFESVVGGVRVKAPMLRIHTVAAGGGSLCRFDGIRLTVGPESAGSDPGPICYGRRDAQGRPTASELTITDINLALGRVAPDRFPFELDPAAVRAALESMVDRLRQAGFERSVDEVAAGFFEIANASMAQAIAEVSVARGADPRDHVLVGFGGAGGQHVCAIARRLGIREILLHPYAGLLSAYGIGIAESSWDGERDGLGRLLPPNGELPDEWETEWNGLAEEGRRALRAGGIREDRIEVLKSLDLRYAGTDTALTLIQPSSGADAATWSAAFEALHHERFGYARPGREVEVKALRLQAIGHEPPPPRIVARRLKEGKPVPLRWEEAWLPEQGRSRVPVFEREAFAEGDRLVGPALILESTGTVVVDPDFALEVDSRGVFRVRAIHDRHEAHDVNLGEADPVRLEVLGNRFMSIAEQMGAVLRNTSFSTNIKERLDYSCAVFDRAGGLVANAPHIPVHLGAMADTVAAMRARFEPFSPGDVIVTNDPFEGGSHLPDVTVVTPVFLPDRSQPSFYVASRGHQADIGGKMPGSMPASSTRLEEEGILIEPFRLVRDGRFDEARIREVLGRGPHPARRPDDNVADLEAMVAANRAGEAQLAVLVESCT
jgi:5-oxoprolinase (ATP-hydrolysing)